MLLPKFFPPTLQRCLMNYMFWIIRYKVSLPSTWFMFCLFASFVCRDSSVGIATRYGLDGPVVEFRWGQHFPHLCRPDVGLIQSPVKCVPGLFPGGNAAGAWSWTPTTSCVEVKERVELYIYPPPSGPLWPVLGWNLFFTVLYLLLYARMTVHLW